jgi:hypothetical protein
MLSMCRNVALNNLLFIWYFVPIHDQGLAMKHVDLNHVEKWFFNQHRISLNCTRKLIKLTQH